MGNLISFNEYVLSEAFSMASMGKVAKLISKYLKKKINKEIFDLGYVEQLEGKQIFGMRFFVPKTGQSFRFNWSNPGKIGMSQVSSLEFWDTHAVQHHVEFKQEVNLVSILPFVASLLKTNKIPSSSLVILNDEELEEGFEYTETMINEGVVDADIVMGVISMLRDKNFTKGKVHRAWKSAGVHVFEKLEELFPDIIVRSGNTFAFEGKPADIKKMMARSTEILDSLGATEATVSKRSTKERYEYNPAVDAIEADRERLTFEKQLEDLGNLVKLTIAGASNALFVAGRGGVGKTHTTEKIMHDMGLYDGKEYFKNTGSISTAGLYSLLFQYKDKIVFFDDSDDVFKDQSSRNLLKACTDTKKIRKLVWSKMGSNVADPDEMTDDEILKAGLVPKYFNFTGKIIFISNLSPDKLDPDGALRTRAFIVNVDPTEVEIYDFMEKIVGSMPLEEGLKLDLVQRKHVVDLLRKGQSKQSPNLRKLSRGLNMAAGALKAGVEVSDTELTRMIASYA